MKVISEKTMSTGKKRVTVELDADEELAAFRNGAHYRLGQPNEDILPAHVMTDAVAVAWCPIEQRWVD